MTSNSVSMSFHSSSFPVATHIVTDPNKQLCSPGDPAGEHRAPSDCPAAAIISLESLCILKGSILKDLNPKIFSKKASGFPPSLMGALDFWHHSSRPALGRLPIKPCRVSDNATLFFQSPLYLSWLLYIPLVDKLGIWFERRMSVFSLWGPLCPPVSWAICVYGRALNNQVWNRMTKKTTTIDSRKLTKTHTKKNESPPMFYEWTKNVYDITQDSIPVAFPTFFCRSLRQDTQTDLPRTPAELLYSLEVVSQMSLYKVHNSLPKYREL